MKYSEDPTKQYHINVRRGDVGEYVILPGDPGRVEKIAAYLSDAQKVASNREFTTYTGYLDGTRVSVTSTGIGGPSAAIAMEELVKCGAKTFIRIGTCGGIQPEVKSGDLVIATAAVRQEGTSREYAPIEYPAAASFQVVEALRDAADELGLANAAAWDKRADELGLENDAVWNKRDEIYDTKTSMYHIGVVQSKDSFYGQHSPEASPVSYDLLNQWESWKRLGVLASEMESAALFTVAAALHVRVGAVFLVMANQEREKLHLDNPVVHDTDLAVRCAVGAVRKLTEFELS